MRNITEKEMQFVLTIARSLETEYSANSIAKRLKMSAMGALKIAKKLEKEEIIIGRNLGRGRFYNLNVKNDYAQQYVKFLLKREAEQSHPYVKSWITQLKKITQADLIIIFGSVLRKHEHAQDIDVLFVMNQKQFSGLKKEIEGINLVNLKKIHAIYQTKKDIEKNIKKNDSVVLNVVKGVVVRGEDLLLEILAKNEPSKKQAYMVLE